MKNIFKKLFRADNAREKVIDGNGLGLYMTKQILENSGGSISFTSTENKGSTFIATLPFSGMVEKKGTKQLSVYPEIKKFPKQDKKK
jgi:signal transduction histidine kinase